MDTGAWLTAARMDRLPLVLRAIRHQPPPGIPVERADRIVWRSCGGPLDEVLELIDVLVRAELVATGAALRLTRQGRHIATQDHQHGGTLLAKTLIRVGFFSDQVRRLTELAGVDSTSGDLRCSRQVALGAGPQLVGVLRRFPGVDWGTELRVPAALVEELVDVWALLPERTPAAEDPRKAVGDRGELYSYRLERLRSEDSGKVHWVARDDETLGYDIEDLSVNPQRRIEAKASASRDRRFILSANEWNVAHREPENYEIHLWGEIDLSRSPVEEYQTLRAAGYPIVYKNPARLLSDGVLAAQPLQYLVQEVRRAEPSRDEHTVL